MTSSRLTPDIVASIEPRLDHAEVCSIIFLLFDLVDVALQHICQEITSSRKYQPVLDSTLFRAGVSLDDGALASWARSCAKRKIDWEDKFLEALMIIKNYSIIKELGKRKEDLDLKFLPHSTDTKYQVDLVRKTLFLMIENFSIQDWKVLENVLLSEARQANVHIEQLYREVPECLLLFLISEGLLKLRQGGQKMDFHLLRGCLKQLNHFDWSEKIGELEDLVNGCGEAIPQIVKPVVSRFDLDPENPGTILIFNVEHYNEKVERNEPLEQRVGSKLDSKKLEDTFKLLGFKTPEAINDPTSEEIINHIRTSLKEFCRDAKESKRERCFVVVILAHGDEGGMYDVNGALVPWNSIQEELRSPETLNLPRLLLIQACKGTSIDKGSSDDMKIVRDGPSGNVPCAANLKDLFELSASVSGFASYRSPQIGSFFIDKFCKNILCSGREVSLHDISLLINEDFKNNPILFKRQNVYMTSELKVTATKRLFLGVSEGKDANVKALLGQWKEIREQHLPSRNSKEKICPETTPGYTCKENQAADQNPDELYMKMKNFVINKSSSLNGTKVFCNA